MTEFFRAPHKSPRIFFLKKYLECSQKKRQKPAVFAKSQEKIKIKKKYKENKI